MIMYGLLIMLVVRNYEGYKMWQFSNIGRIDGIYGDVDLNVMVVD